MADAVAADAQKKRWLGRVLVVLVFGSVVGSYSLGLSIGMDWGMAWGAEFGYLNAIGHLGEVEPAVVATALNMSGVDATGVTAGDFADASGEVAANAVFWESLAWWGGWAGVGAGYAASLWATRRQWLRRLGATVLRGGSAPADNGK